MYFQSLQTHKNLDLEAKDFLLFSLSKVMLNARLITRFLFSYDVIKSRDGVCDDSGIV